MMNQFNTVSHKKNRKSEFLMILIMGQMLWLLWCRGVVRVIVTLVGGRSLLRCSLSYCCQTVTALHNAEWVDV